MAETIRAPRGSALSCKGWVQEAALRMLMNNLDPDVAENPKELVVYGGIGRAFGNGQDQVIEQAGGASYQVFVPPGDGVERTWVNGNAVIEWLQVQSLASRGSVSCCSNW